MQRILSKVDQQVAQVVKIRTYHQMVRVNKDISF
jgi:hypothetical protein